LADNPVLGHITTFGGHPVCCAAGYAAMQALLEERYILQAEEKASLFKHLLVHPAIKGVNSFGLWLAIQFESFTFCKKVIDYCIENGVVTDWFLFADNCLRISPPLTISKKEIERSCNIILAAIEVATKAERHLQ
jgi:acetylornithine/succinyldiaminopimelate/putrescine aminotransferase